MLSSLLCSVSPQMTSDSLLFLNANFIALLFHPACCVLCNNMYIFKCAKFSVFRSWNTTNHTGSEGSKHDRRQQPSDEGRPSLLVAVYRLGTAGLNLATQTRMCHSQHSVCLRVTVGPVLTGFYYVLPVDLSI